MDTTKDLARKNYINFVETVKKHTLTDYFKCTHHLCVTGEENHSYCNE